MISFDAAHAAVHCPKDRRLQPLIRGMVVFSLASKGRSNQPGPDNESSEQNFASHLARFALQKGDICPADPSFAQAFRPCKPLPFRELQTARHRGRHNEMEFRSSYGLPREV